MGVPSYVSVTLVLLIVFLPTGAQDLQDETVQFVTEESSLRLSDPLFNFDSDDAGLIPQDEYQMGYEFEVSEIETYQLESLWLESENLTKSKESSIISPNIDPLLGQISDGSIVSNDAIQAENYRLSPQSKFIMAELNNIAGETGSRLINHPVNGVYESNASIYVDTFAPSLNIIFPLDTSFILEEPSYSSKDIEALDLAENSDIPSSLNNIEYLEGDASAAYDISYSGSYLGKYINCLPSLSGSSQILPSKTDFYLNEMELAEKRISSGSSEEEISLNLVFHEILNQPDSLLGIGGSEGTAPSAIKDILSLMSPNISAPWLPADMIRDQYLNIALDNYLKNSGITDNAKADELFILAQSLGSSQWGNEIYDASELSLNGASSQLDLTNYAVVVGINSYSDRSRLSAPVNDAEKLAELLEECNYRVIKLTDDTEDKPTKQNILEEALAEVKAAPDKGNVIVYFSGHGEVGPDGKFYLMPQDANDTSSSYISEEELRRYVGGIPRLSLIVDACYSGKLCDMIGKGQLILASSNENEPSNELWQWFDDNRNSVFTYFLCQAIEEERKESGIFRLERCFLKAKNDTLNWAHGRLMVQTPVMKGGTGGSYRQA